MNTKQIIEEMEKLFDEKFPCINAGCDNNGTIANRVSDDEWEPEQCEYCFRNRLPFKSFIHSYTRKLIESVAEEMKYIVALHRLSAWSPQDKDLELISKGSKTTADAITDDIDLKVQEIINQISK